MLEGLAAMRLGVAGSSVAVLAFLVFFALAGPSNQLNASIGPVVPRPGSAAVVEGRVLTANGFAAFYFHPFLVDLLDDTVEGIEAAAYEFVDPAAL